jgi:DNA replication protein DnaC
MSEPQSASDFVPAFAAKLKAIHEKWMSFCAEQQPKIEAAPQSKSCKEHPTILRQILVEETCQNSLRDGEFSPTYAPCPECESTANLARWRAYWKKRGVPERVIDAKFSNFLITEPDGDKKRAALSAAQRWIKENGCFLLLAGTPGTGKGHLASACLKAHGNGIFITQADMLMDLRASYTLGNTKTVVEAWQDTDCLILDEFGLSVGGKDEEPLLYQVLASRHDSNLPTVITSNKRLSELKDLLGFRLYDRISEKCTAVVMNWESYRRKKEAA